MIHTHLIVYSVHPDSGSSKMNSGKKNRVAGETRTRIPDFGIFGPCFADGESFSTAQLLSARAPCPFTHSNHAHHVSLRQTALLVHLCVWVCVFVCLKVGFKKQQTLTFRVLYIQTRERAHRVCARVCLCVCLCVRERCYRHALQFHTHTLTA